MADNSINLYILTDYKGFFGNKRFSVPYRSGMDLNLLAAGFKNRGFSIKYIPLYDIDLRTMNLKGSHILYTSSEDSHSLYKGYIEDICYGLTLQGAHLVPSFQYIRAHNNKVFMEILRDVINNNCMNTIKGHCYGCIEELENGRHRYNGQVVIKGAEGAKSSSVFLADGSSDIIKKAKSISTSNGLYETLWDFGRSLKHRCYVRESRYRRKFITQNFVPGLKNDWKILVFGEKIYTLYRSTREKDFRASGSGIFDFDKDLVTDEMLDYAMEIYKALDVPHVSLDIGYDGECFYLFEFQAIYFGSYTLERSPFFFIKNNDNWETVSEPSVLEEVYAESVARYIRKKQSTRE